MTTSTTIRLTAALAVSLLVSCGTYLPVAEQSNTELRGNSLANADNLLKKAGRISTNPEAATVYQMRAAEIAWGQLDTGGGEVKNISQLPENQQHALRILTTATEGVSMNFVGPSAQPEKQFSYAGFSYRINAGLAPKPGVYPLAHLESAKPAREIKRTLCKNWHTDTGAGAPFAPVWKRPTDPKVQRFVSQRGYLEPITAVLNFDAPVKPGAVRAASLTGYDPTYVSRVKLGRTEYPLAADFTAPIVEQTADINEFKLALTGLIHPGVLDSKLILLEPFDPARIPVLLVHGLNSHPRMWRDVINDLRADPKLRGRYQFMIFYYPTGWPIAYSAMRLREELTALESQFGHPKKMVLVGHSMGGLLSRMQVISPGRKIWDTRLGKDADKLYAKLPADHLLKRMAFFTADPNISREIYICTPQRGSGLADLSLTSWFIKILKLPSTITGALIDMPKNLFTQGTFNSVAGLSPKNPLYTVLDQVPIQVPHHSIIGDRGKGDTPNSSDGVVPYWSSHLKSAQSEVIVPDSHGAYDDPQAILELRRILLINAGIKN
jgi:hypothetical protein